MSLARELLVDLPVAVSARVRERIERIAASSTRTERQVTRAGRRSRRTGHLQPVPTQPPLREQLLGRAYDAGIVDRLRAGWLGASATVNAEIYTYLRTMRDRSRDHAENNPWSARWLDLCRRNVVGPRGFRFQSLAMRQNGRDPDRDDRRMLEAAWRDFSSAGQFDTSGKLSRAASERLFITTASQDGEVLVRKVRGFARNRWNYAVRFLETSRLDLEYNEARDPATGRRWIMGVELDDDDRPTRYALLYTPPGAAYPDSAVSGFTSRGDHRELVPADEVIHGFIANRPEQARGVPWAHAAMVTLEDYDGFSQAVVVNARAGANKLAWFKRGGSMDGMVDDYGTDGEGNRVPIQQSEPGEFGDLPADAELVEWKPNFPDAAVDPFSAVLLRGTAMALGVEYHSLTGDLARVNFATGRIGAVTERDLWMALQDWTIDAFPADVFEDWLRWQLTRGGLVGMAGNTIPPTAYAKLSRVRWQGRRWQYYQPLQEAQAHASQISARIRSRTEICDETGRDFEDVVDLIAAEEAYMRDQGVDPSSLTSFAATGEAEDSL